MTDEQLAMLDDLLRAEDLGLSGKAIDFLDSLDRRRWKPLSEKQADWLNDLAEQLP